MAKNTSSRSSQPRSAMAALMAKHQDKFVSLKKGESVKGKITKISQSEILVDLGAKTEATIMEKDKNILRTILGMFKLGDTVEVNVLNPESESGQPVVSLRRFLGKIAWDKLEKLEKSHEQIEVAIEEIGKAGFVVNTSFGISGFLPGSHAAGLQEATIGQKINVAVLEINKEDNKIIFSQKVSITDEEFEQLMKKIKVGQKVKATVSNITQFGLFVSLDGIQTSLGSPIEGFIHISEVAWDKVDDLLGMFTPGQDIEAVIARFDKDTKRINLSIKKLTKDPFEELIEKFPVDKKITGEVLSVEDSGITVSLGENIEGFIKKDKIPPTATYAVGQEINVTVSEHDMRRHKINLTPVLLEKPIGYR